MESGAALLFLYPDPWSGDNMGSIPIGVIVKSGFR
nr:MAG TPA: hypothetical protein [Caudoviricetes sp.]